jgi:hypothetical protein
MTMPRKIKKNPVDDANGAPAMISATPTRKATRRPELGGLLSAPRCGCGSSVLMSHAGRAWLGVARDRLREPREPRLLLMTLDDRRDCLLVGPRTMHVTGDGRRIRVSDVVGSWADAAGLVNGWLSNSANDAGNCRLRWRVVGGSRAYVLRARVHRRPLRPRAARHGGPGYPPREIPNVLPKGRARATPLAKYATHHQRNKPPKPAETTSASR